MPLLAAALVVAIVTVYYVSKVSTKLPATVTFAKPTTVIPAATAILAGVVVVFVVALSARAGLPPIWVLGLAAVVGFTILGMGSTTAGSRVVYDRGGRRMPPGELIGVVAFAVILFLALQQ